MGIYEQKEINEMFKGGYGMYKLKIVASTQMKYRETRWLNITPNQLKKIQNVLR